MPQIETYLYLQNFDWKWNRWLSRYHVYRKTKQYVAKIYIIIIDRWPCSTASPGCWAVGHINWPYSVWWGKTYFVLGWPEQLRQDKIFCTGTTSPMNQSERQREAAPADLLKLRWIGTQRIHMTGFPSWIISLPKIEDFIAYSSGNIQ